METEFEPSPEAAELLRQDPDRYSSLSHAQWMFLVYGGSERGHDQQTRVLFEHDLLGEEERSVVIRQWRAQFEKGERLADIPPRLRREWERSRRRRGKMVCEPEITAVDQSMDQPPPAA